MINSIFNLKTDVNDLTYDNIDQMKYEQITATRDIKLKNFSNGDIVYKFRTTGQDWWLPNRSYLRVRIKLLDGRNDQIERADNVALNMNVVSTLFKSMELKINNKTISRVNDFIPQIDTLEKRITKSRSWVNSIGDGTDMIEADLSTRAREISSDGGEGYRSVQEVELIFQPLCLSLFKIDHALPCGDFQLCLTPRNFIEHQLYAIESEANKQVELLPALGDANKIKLSVTNMKFYAAIVKGPRVDNQSYLIELCQTRCQSEQVKSNELSKKTFTVSPSTHALTVAYQDIRCGPQTKFSISKFKSYDNAGDLDEQQEDKITRFYINYAGQQYPQKDEDISYVFNEQDYSTRMYMDTQLNSGAYFDTGGAFDNWDEFKTRGAYYHYRIYKDGSNRSTEVTVSQQFLAGAEIQNTRVLLFDHSKQIARIRVQDGQIVDVQLVDA
jgi:hypothetical protein